ncbi:hypothetical protein ACQ4PT_052939 [Festuca glaucescens]
MATRRAKKRKCRKDELDAGVTPPASEKPEAVEGTDQISNLPSDVLRRIVSLLPTKDGARTQFLSTPWRHLFRSAPLNLGVVLRREDEPAPSSLVSRILADHQAPCRRLSLTWYGYKSDFVSPLLNRWLQSPALEGLAEFDLWQNRKENGKEYWRVPREEQSYTLPPSVFGFSPTLRILSIKCTGYMIHFPSTPAEAEGFTKAKLESVFLQRIVAISPMSVVRSVKVLVLRLSPPSVDDAIDFMTFFPCLEKLYVLLYRAGTSKRARHHFPLDLECLELHLKKVVLINYQGTARDIHFARFFLSNAKVLEHMEYATRREKKCDFKWIADQHRNLQLDKRASQGAQFCFNGNSYFSDDIHIGHIHDLTVVDPFDRSLCRCHSVDFL